MKYCQQCGAQLEEEMKFCVYCGASAEDSANAQQEQNPWNNYNSSHQSQETYGQNRSGQNGQNMNCQNNGFQNNNAAGYGQMPGPYGGGIHGIERRSIPLSVILTIVTCGLYGLYWIIKLNDEINQLAGEPNATSSGMVILLSIVTSFFQSPFRISAETTFSMVKIEKREGLSRKAPQQNNLAIPMLSFYNILKCKGNGSIV